MKYKNLLFVPLALEFDVKEFLGEIPDVTDPTHISPTYSPFWTYEQLLNNPDPWGPGNMWRDDLSPFQNKLKSLVKLLPFTEYHNIRFSVQNETVKPHVDVSFKECPLPKFLYYQNIEPCGYRFLLKGNSSALKIHINNRVIKTELPPAPSAYIINASKCYHSVDNDNNRVTLYCRGDVDVDAHTKLIEKSLLKYSSQAIFQ